MPKKLLILDIDETLLSMPIAYRLLLNKAARASAVGKVGLSTFLYRGAYSLYPTKFRALFARIQEHNKSALNDEQIIVGFVTAGQITREKIKGFFKSQYGYDLGENHPHCRRTMNWDKPSVVQNIATGAGVELSNVVFADNDRHIITNIAELKCTAIHAPNNPSRHDGTDCVDTRCYIEKIERALLESSGQDFISDVAAAPKESEALQIARRYIPRGSDDSLERRKAGLFKGYISSQASSGQSAKYNWDDRLINKHRHLAIRIAATVALCVISLGILAFVGFAQYALTDTDYKPGSFLFLKPTHARELVADISEASTSKSFSYTS